jgi:hypothetical protein
MQIHPDVWVHRAIDSIENYKGRPFHFVISDGRFANEYTVLKEKLPDFDVRAVKIVRKIEGQPEDPHRSEHEIDSLPNDMFDLTVLNSGTTSQLHLIAEDYVVNYLFKDKACWCVARKAESILPEDEQNGEFHGPEAADSH